MTTVRALGLVAVFAAAGGIAEFALRALGTYFILDSVLSRSADASLQPHEFAPIFKAQMLSAHSGLLAGAIIGAAIVAILTWQHVRLSSRS